MTRGLLISAVLLLGLVCSCTSGRERPTTPAPESVPATQTQRSGAAPDFTLDDIDGDEFRLQDHLDGSVMLLYFWATCCEPCRVEMPHLERLYQTYRARGFELVAISMDGPETIARVRSYVSRYGLTFTALLDDETEVTQMYNPRRASPFSVLIDQEGSVVWSREGYSPGDEMALEELMVEMLERQELSSQERR